MKISKEDRKIIKQLKEEKNFDEIYEKYGRKIYLKNTDIEEQQRDVDYLKSTNQLKKIKEKYGIITYILCLDNMKYKKIVETKGKKKAKIWKVSLITRRIIGAICFLYSVPLVGCGVFTDVLTFKNKIVHSDEIDEYEKKITEYAKKVNKLNLTDIQVFMKVYQDIWSNARSF